MARSNLATLLTFGFSGVLLVGLGWLALSPKPQPAGESGGSANSPPAPAPTASSVPSAEVPNVNTQSEPQPTQQELAPAPPPQKPISDRERANKLREALMALYGAGAGGAGSAPPAPRDQTALTPYIRTLLEGPISAGVTSCFEHLLERAPRAAGALLLELAVMGDPAFGGVIANTGFGASTTLKDAAFRSCLTSKFGALVLPPPPSGHAAFTIEQSFELEP